MLGVAKCFENCETLRCNLNTAKPQREQQSRGVDEEDDAHALYNQHDRVQRDRLQSKNAQRSASQRNIDGSAIDTASDHPQLMLHRSLLPSQCQSAQRFGRTERGQGSKFQMLCVT